MIFSESQKTLARNAGNAGTHGRRSAGAGASKRNARAWWLWFSAVTRTVPLAFAVSYRETHVPLGPRTPGTPSQGWILQRHHRRGSVGRRRRRRMPGLRGLELRPAGC